jgi:hypothetical protein
MALAKRPIVFGWKRRLFFGIPVIRVSINASGNAIITYFFLNWELSECADLSPLNRSPLDRIRAVTFNSFLHGAGGRKVCIRRVFASGR